MPNNTKTGKTQVALPTIPKKLIDQFVSGPMNAQAVNAASMAFKKALIERALGAELSHHLGYAPGTDKPQEVSKHRNGASAKTVLTEDGPLRIDVPRDHAGRSLASPPPGAHVPGGLLRCATRLKIRGCNDVLSAVTDGLKDMGEALGAVLPATTLQRPASCI